MLGHIGPYDKFAIKWGYKPIPSAANPDQRSPRSISGQPSKSSTQSFSSGNYAYNEDPETQSECIGKDAVRSSRLGLKNIDRVAKQLVPAAAKYGDNYDSLQELYGVVVNQRFTELARILRYVRVVSCRRTITLATASLSSSRFQADQPRRFPSSFMKALTCQRP